MTATRLPIIIPGIEVYLLPLDGTGRDAERRAVDTLAATVLGSAILHRPDGSPYVAADPSRAVTVSHGGSVALLAVGSATPIGIDIESSLRHKQLARVARKFVAEADELSALSLLHLWTAKEAVYKAMGMPGLGLTAITVGASGHATAAGRRLKVAWQPCGTDALIALAAVQP